jgi:glucose/arabinose dehydrogenase
MNAKLLTLSVTIATMLAAPAVVGADRQAQQGPPQGQTQSKPDPKPEAKPEATPDIATVAGKWNVNIETPNGAIQSALELKVDGKKVAGAISSQMGEAVLEGEIAEGKLTFWFTMDANGTSISVTFAGTMQKDGSLAGTLEYGQGDVPWTATRVKG